MILTAGYDGFAKNDDFYYEKICIAYLRKSEVFGETSQL